MTHERRECASLRALPALLAAALAPAALAGVPHLPCSACAVTFGVGATYRYFGSTGGVDVPFTLDLDEDRYELGVFGFASEQHLDQSVLVPYKSHFIAPYWSVSASRRWRVFTRAALRVFVGAGVSWKSQRDILDSTQWNFAWQLGARWRVRKDLRFELTVRHWSNAGIRTPNRGQDFATLALVF